MPFIQVVHEIIREPEYLVRDQRHKIKTCDEAPHFVFPLHLNAKFVFEALIK